MDEIELPKFDEKEFLRRERRKAKTAFVASIFGFFIAIICHFVWRSVDESIRWPLCFFFAIASIGFMAKILEFLKVDIKAFSRKEWFGSIAFYILTWLAIFIVSINPPFYDASPPKMEVVMLPEIQQNGGNILVAAHITDNVGVDCVKIKIDGKEYEMLKDEDNVYIYNYSGGNADFQIIASDKGGHIAKYNASFHFTDNLVKVIAEEKLNASDEIIIKVYRNISKEKFRVFYLINGYEINATETGKSGDFLIYSTSPRYEGWKKDAENRLDVYVEIIHYFRGIDKAYRNLIYGGNYTIKTTADNNIGLEPSPQIKGLPQPQSLRTPAFEFVLAIAGVGIAMLFRRKKR